MKHNYLEFEKELMRLAAKVEEHRTALGKDLTQKEHEKHLKLIRDLEEQQQKEILRLYKILTPWQKTQVARHPNRPHGGDYIQQLFTDFTPIAGDRRFAEDAAIIAGIAQFEGRPVAVVATEKGVDTKTRVKHNFGMPKPEGYRKALRLFALADKFGLPIITFVDTPGAYPGVEAEARGQAEAIAACIEHALGLQVPVVAYITGEGGSGGALALATADKVFMLEHSVYSVISPEGCASILWRDQKEAQKAAEALRLTAQDALAFGVIEGILPEPEGAAHRDPHVMMMRLREHLSAILAELERVPYKNFSLQRRQRFLNLGPQG